MVARGPMGGAEAHDLALAEFDPLSLGSEPVGIAPLLGGSERAGRSLLRKELRQDWHTRLQHEPLAEEPDQREGDDPDACSRTLSPDMLSLWDTLLARSESRRFLPCPSAAARRGCGAAANDHRARGKFYIPGRRWRRIAKSGLGSSRHEWTPLGHLRANAPFA